jgi:uncharacterized membrane protein YbhN (UPF0104 family)
MTGPPSVRAVLASSRTRVWLNALAGAAILIAVIAQAGAEPFLRGLGSVSPGAIAAALALAAIATWAAAWRWRLIAAGLGVPLGQAGAVAAYYRSQFLNTVLPGGVVGDVHRAVAHGRSVDQLANASRAVAAERGAGQAVQLVLAAVVLAALGISAYAPAVGVMLVAVVVACAGVAAAAALSLRIRALVLRELRQVRAAFRARRTVVAVVAASTVVVLCHVTTFIVASVAVGVTAAPPRLAAMGLIAVLAGSIPFNIGGWGPRESAAAWAFAAVGLGSATGLAASTAYGVLAMIAVAPGAAVVAASALQRRRGTRQILAVPGEEPS